MIEKIKISVPEKIRELMRRDAKDFRICKPSGEENLNSFINILIVNFYETFTADDEKLRDSVANALATIPEKYAKEAFSQVMKAIAQRDKEENFGKSVPVAFKPTKVSQSVTVYIENVLLKNESLSSFYRRMFMAYAKRPKNERERIIHKQSFDLLSNAIKKGLQVCISLDNGQVVNDASLYAIADSKDELFNYALLYANKKNHTVRIAKVKTVSLLTTIASIPESNQSMFARQVVAGAQYPIYSTDDEPIKVQLTAKGKQLFDKVYLYRPTPTSIDGDIYTFDCSANQALYYFERFGSEALILSPKRLGIFMRNYYHYALKKYRTIYRKD